MGARWERKPPFTAEALARARKLSERRLTREELDACVNQPMSIDELEGITHQDPRP